jgi:hypothetical protein
LGLLSAVLGVAFIVVFAAAKDIRQMTVVVDLPNIWSSPQRV